MPLIRCSTCRNTWHAPSGYSGSGVFARHAPDCPEGAYEASVRAQDAKDAEEDARGR